MSEPYTVPPYGDPTNWTKNADNTYTYKGPHGTASGKRILSESNYSRLMYYHRNLYEKSIWSSPSPGIRKKPSSAVGLPIKSSAAAGLPLIKSLAAIKASSAAAGLPINSSAVKKVFSPTLKNLYTPGMNSYSVPRPDTKHGGSRSRRTVHRKHKSYRKSKRVRHTRRKQTRRHRHRR